MVKDSDSSDDRRHGIQDLTRHRVVDYDSLEARSVIQTMRARLANHPHQGEMDEPLGTAALLVELRGALARARLRTKCNTVLAWKHSFQVAS